MRQLQGTTTPHHGSNKPKVTNDAAQGGTRKEKSQKFAARIIDRCLGSDRVEVSADFKRCLAEALLAASIVPDFATHEMAVNSAFREALRNAAPSGVRTGISALNDGSTLVEWREVNGMHHRCVLNIMTELDKHHRRLSDGAVH